MSRKIKLYLHSNYKDTNEQLDTYLKVFNASEYKRNSYSKEFVEKHNLDKSLIGEITYANIKINEDMHIMMAKYSKDFNTQPYGSNVSFVLFFDDDKDSFNSIYKNMVESDAFEMQYDKDLWTSWNTQIAKFHDKFGCAWVLELDIAKVDNDWNPKML